MTSPRLTLSLDSDGSDIPAVGAAAQAFASGRGASDEESRAASEVLTGILGWVSSTCFPDPARGRIDVSLIPGDDGLHVAIADDGIPLAPFGSGLGAVPDELSRAAWSVADLHLVNLRDRGKQMRFVVPTARPLTSDRDDEPEQVGAAPEEIVSRLATPEDALAVGRVMHAVYGLEYGHTEFYDPEQLVAAWDRGDAISAVAVVRGELVGHMAFFREPGGLVFEMGAAAVDPRYRSLGLTRLMGTTLGAEAFARGAQAVSLHMVTTHARTQSGPAQMGFVATGLMIGAAPPAIAGEPRQTLLLAYLPLVRHPRPVAMPSDATYVDALTPVYARMGLDVVAQDVATALAETGDAPGIELSSHPGDSTPVHLTIRRWGPKHTEDLVNRLRDAVTSGAAMVYVDLDLHTLTRQEMDEIKVFLGYYDFFASGLLIYSQFGHDHLRLQAMLSRDLQLDDIVLHTDEARWVRAAVFRDHNQLARKVEGSDEHDL